MVEDGGAQETASLGISGSVDSGLGDTLLVEGSVDRGRNVLDVVSAEELRRVVDQPEATLIHGRCGWLRLPLLWGPGGPL